MNQKLLIVLFSTIFYNGVTCSSLKEQSDVKSPEEKLQKTNSLVTDDIKKKVEPTPMETSTDHLVSASPNVAATISQQTEISAAPSAITSVPILKNNSIETVKKEDLDSVNQNKAKVADNNTSSHAVERESITSSNDVSAPNNSHVFSSTNVPLTSTDVTTIPITKTTATTSSTTNPSVRTTIKPNPVSNVPPAPALTTKVVTEQNTPAPSEEKHFDGPSFVGGIVLAVGVIAIGFIAFKYYKSGKIDMNYRTL